MDEISNINTTILYYKSETTACPLHTANMSLNLLIRIDHFEFNSPFMIHSSPKTSRDDLLVLLK